MPNPKIGETGLDERSPDESVAQMRAVLDGMLERSGRPDSYDQWLSLTQGDRDLANVLSHLDRQIAGQKGRKPNLREVEGYVSTWKGERKDREMPQPPMRGGMPAPMPMPSAAVQPSLEGYSPIQQMRAVPFAGASTPFGDAPPLPSSFFDSTMGRDFERRMTRPALPDVPVGALPAPRAGLSPAQRQRFGPGGQ